MSLPFPGAVLNRPGRGPRARRAKPQGLPLPRACKALAGGEGRQDFCSGMKRRP